MTGCDEFTEKCFTIDTLGERPAVNENAPKQDLTGCTVFVRNLPFDFTDDQLQQTFEDVAPIKRSFLITGKGAGSQRSKGFGFVVFTDKADAEDAIEQMNGKLVSGRKIKVELARDQEPKTRKPKQEELNKQEEIDEEQHTSEQEIPEEDLLEVAAEAIEAAEVVAAKDKVDSQPKAPERRIGQAEAPSDDSKTIVLEHLPSDLTQPTLLKRARKIAAVDTVLLPSPESTEMCRTARVVFKTAAGALKGVKKLDQRKIGETLVRAGFLNPKAARLIVRNLPFNITEKRVRQLMKDCGAIVEVELPKNPNASLARGFCFVQFESVADAAKAITTKNRARIGSRTVAVDWCLPKNVFAKRVEAEKEEVDEEENSEDVVDEGDESGEDNDEDDDDDASEEDGDDEEEEKESEDVKKELRTSRDVEEGRTVFIRNLAFSCSEVELQQCFEQFGEVKRASIVMDHALKRPKGVAFVQFATSEAAAAAVARAAEGKQQCSNAPKQKQRKQKNRSLNDSGLLLGGRVLDVAVAVDRKRAAELEQQNLLKPKEDRRREHLSREGLIREGDSAAEHVPKRDMIMRAKIWKNTREKMKNPNFVMSNTRLSVHNLPPDMDEKALKALFRANVKPAPGTNVRIQQCKIVRDRNRIGADGVGRSLCFGFVEFDEHAHALQALRDLNNNPDALGKKRRLIVAFSVEDQRKLLARRKRLEKFDQERRIRDEAKEQEKKQAEDQAARKRKRPRRDTGEKEKILLKRVKKASAETETASPVPKKEDRTLKRKQERAERRKQKQKKTGESGAGEVDTTRQNKRQKQQKNEEKFENLVAEYRNKYFGSDVALQKAKRWFD